MKPPINGIFVTLESKPIGLYVCCVTITSGYDKRKNISKWHRTSRGFSVTIMELPVILANELYKKHDSNNMWSSRIHVCTWSC